MTGTSRPIVIFQHYGFDTKSATDTSGGGSGWWNTTNADGSTPSTAANMQTFLSMLPSYNVIGMFTGHVHATGAYFTTLSNGKVIDDFVGGTGGIDQCEENDGNSPDCGGRGNFFAVHVNNQVNHPNAAEFLDVASVEWRSPANNPQEYPTPYYTNMSTPAFAGTAKTGMQGPAFGTGALGCRKLISNNLVDYSSMVTITAAPYENYASKVTVTNNTGATFYGNSTYNPMVLEVPNSIIAPATAALPSGLNLGGFAGFTNASGQAFVDRCGGQEIALQNGAVGYNAPAIPNVFLMSDASYLEPGQQMTFYVAFPLNSYTNFKFYAVGMDTIVPAANNVVVSPSQPATLPVKMATGLVLPLSINYQNGTDSWLTVTPSGSTFPTTLTFTMKSVPTIGTVGSISLVNPSDQTIEPQTITIQVGTPVTVDSSTAGLSITVDGNNVTTPQFFLWVPGSTHQITAPNTQPGLSNGTMAAFQSWTGYPFYQWLAHRSHEWGGGQGAVHYRLSVDGQNRH